MLGERTILHRECIETLGIPGSISHNNLGSKVCVTFREGDADIDLVNIKACYCLKSNHWPKKVIV